jgi:uncharacterized membrane protein
MRIPDFSMFKAGFFDFMDSPTWRAWPFNAGYGEQLLPSIARLAFVTLILALIVLFLRVLFGPNGWFRDEEMDREAEEERKREKKDLDRMLEQGEISQMDYDGRLKRLKD